MREVTINKNELRERVQQNRNKHRALYEEAREGYYKQVEKFFKEQLKRVRAGEDFVSYFNDPVPEDHTDDYDNVLDMLDMALGANITLSNQEFRQYVRDDWGWKTTFTATTSTYLNS